MYTMASIFWRDPLKTADSDRFQVGTLPLYWKSMCIATSLRWMLTATVSMSIMEQQQQFQDYATREVES